MKLIFSIVCALSFSLTIFARDIVLITYNTYYEKAELTQKILIEQIHIPLTLIKMNKKENPCLLETQAAFHICIDENEEMIILKKDEKLAKEAFAIFQKGLTK